MNPRKYKFEFFIIFRYRPIDKMASPIEIPTPAAENAPIVTPVEGGEAVPQQLFNLYMRFGLHFPLTEEKNVFAALSASKQFSDLTTGKQAVTINDYVYDYSKNGQINPTMGVIYCDDMTNSEDLDDKVGFLNVYNRIDPAQLLEDEKEFAECIKILNKIESVIYAYYKANKLSIASFYFGWQDTPGIYLDDGSSSSKGSSDSSTDSSTDESSESDKKPAPRAGKKPVVKQPSKKAAAKNNKKK